MPDSDDATQAPKPLGSTASWAQPARSGPPQRIGRFAITQVLGQGAFGCVYLALDTELQRQVAIKVPHADALTPDMRERFLREARATATIHHRNVCPIYDVQNDDGTGAPYIVMHYVVGTTLASLLNKMQTPLPPRHALAIARKLALGMAAAHAKGVVHRDLKPANVLYETATREVVITDFGLALLGGESRMTADGAVRGTPAFMSPEQAKGRVNEVGPASDVYALGVILYRMLTGDVPFRGSVFEVMMQHAEAQPRFPSQAYPGLDPRLDTICMKAMAKRPEDRYPSAQALADALTAYLRVDGRTDSDAELPFAQALADETLAQSHQTARRALPAARPQPAAAPSKRGGGRILLAGLLVLLLAGGAAGWYLATRDQSAATTDGSDKTDTTDKSGSSDGPKVLPVAPPPRLKEPPKPDVPPKKEVVKFDAKKLVGKWERIEKNVWLWELNADGTSVRNNGPKNTFIATYTLEGDALTFSSGTRSHYTVVRLNDDELELRAENATTTMVFKRVKPKPDVKKLYGKWERTEKGAWLWEFNADNTSVRTNGPGKSTPATYTLEGDALTFSAGLQTHYTVIRLTDDELELKGEKATTTMVFKRVKTAKKLVGKWERTLKGMPQTWEFTKDDKLVWSTSPTTTRTYKASDAPPYELTVTVDATTTNTYAIEKLTDDELELRPMKGPTVVLKRAKP